MSLQMLKKNKAFVCGENMHLQASKHLQQNVSVYPIPQIREWSLYGIALQECSSLCACVCVCVCVCVFVHVCACLCGGLEALLVSGEQSDMVSCSGDPQTN